MRGRVNIVNNLISVLFSKDITNFLVPGIVGSFRSIDKILLLSSVSDTDPDSVRSVDLDPDPVGQKGPTKIGKNLEFSCFEVMDVLFLRAEGFFCSLEVLYGGLGIGELQFLIKIFFFFS
jgi:hypothetical protein